MFFQRKRVEEDLARIRKANLSPEQLKHEEEEKQKADAKMKENVLGMEAKDIFAMIIAVFSLLLPYVLGLLAVWALVAWLFTR